MKLKHIIQFNKIKISILTFLLLASIAYSQIKVNNVREGYYKIYTADSIRIDNKSSEIEAIQGLTNYQLSTGKKGYIIPPSYRVDITGINIVINDIEIDTFTTIADYILLDFTDSLVQPTEESKKYALVMGIGLVEIEADTIHRWQSIFKLERTREFGKARYKSIEIPFQFRDSLMLDPDRTTYRLQTFATKKHCVSYFLNNQEYSINRSCNPGQISSIEWRHTMTYEGLEPDTEYLVRIEGTSESGEIDFKEFKIKTLK